MEIARFENLELLARQAVEGFIIGLHRSPFHGFSVEFAEHRLYNAGDPIKHIDWRVYGRTDRLFIKKYEEETNLRCCIMIDTSSSMLFPMRNDRLNKLQFSCWAAASLLELFKKQLDAASLALFDSEMYMLSECRSSSRHYRELTNRLESLLNAQELGKESAIAQNLHLIAERMHKRSLIVVFTDFIEPTDEQDLFAALQHLRYNKHEVILFQVMDRKQEIDWNWDNRPYEFMDMESSERIQVQPAQVKDQYLKEMKAWRERLALQCQQYHIDLVEVDLQEPVSKVLHQYLLKRNKLL